MSRDPRVRAVQYHNQPADSPLHRWLTAMWAAVREETGGRFEVDTCPRNNDIAGGDPAALELLLAGEIFGRQAWSLLEAHAGKLGDG